MALSNGKSGGRNVEGWRGDKKASFVSRKPRDGFLRVAYGKRDTGTELATLQG